MPSTDCELWLCVDTGGDYGVGRDADGAKSNYDDQVQSLADAEGFRLYKLTLTVPVPQIVELSGAVAEGQEGAVTLNV